MQGRGLANRIERSSLVVTPAPQAKVKGVEPSQPAGAAAPQVAAIAAAPSPQAAVQILSILQRQGRLIDFLQEDLTPYDDSQIGAAVRSIHQGCREALQEHMDLKPIFGEPEGEPVSVPAGFDSRAVRLTGNVSGDPPFKGTLRHRGWRVERLELPRATTEQTKDWVIAPAEVEIEN
ncbi:MAG: DUF2760 domain-containing protein [Deltaproteobacteria bacterium]|nr:DUF2760 domain-containing protein [Deltaproteobacteria bacterium]